MRDTFIFALALTMAFSAAAVSRFLSRPARQEALFPPIETRVDALPAVEMDGRAWIDVNQADEQTLAMLDGIGEVLAARIVADREAYGPFHSLEELTRVNGIGEATVARIRERAVARAPGAAP